MQNFSKKILGNSKMSWFEYIFGYCIPTGFQTMNHAFINWMDLVWFEDNQKNYTLLSYDDPLEQCRLYFWDELQDDVYPKEFIEKLYSMVDEIDRGEVELIPFDLTMLDEIEDLVGNMKDETNCKL